MELNFGRNSYLSASVTELCERCMEEAILFVEWSYLYIRMCLFCLKSHVCIGDLGDGGAENLEVSIYAQPVPQSTLGGALTNRIPLRGETQIWQ